MKQILPRLFKFIRSSRKKAILIGLSIIVVLVSVSALILYWPRNAEAAWFDDNWAYRNRVPITSHTSLENNVYIIATIDTSASGQFQSDCGDLRWTDNSGKILQYYIVSGCTTSSTVVHVFFDIMPAGAQTIYYYYGNPGAANGFVSVDFTTQATAYVVGTIASQEKGGAPSLYSKLDEGTGTTTQDSTKNGITGTLSGSTTPTWQTEDQCINGKCLFFNGTTSYVNYGTPSVLTGMSQISISFWAKPSSVSVDTGFINNHHAGLDTDGSWEIRVDNTGILTFQLDGVACSSGKIYQNGLLTSSYTQAGNFSTAVSTKALTANTWTHIEGTASGCSSLLMPYNLAIGYKELDFSGNPTNFYQGFMDDVKIYKYERTAAQVKSDYISRGSLKGNSATLGASIQDLGSTLGNGLIGYWKMDDSSWTNDCSTSTVTDSSGNGSSLLSCPNTGGPTTPAAGKFGTAASFNGSTNYFCTGSGSCGSTTLYNLNSNLTVSAWIYPTSTSSYHAVITKTNDNGVTGYDLGVNAGNISFYIDNAGCNTGSIPINTWTLVTGVYDGKNAIAYINGVEACRGTATTLSTTTGPLAIGARFSSGLINGTSFPGSIDEARVYNRSFSPSEIQTLYNWAPGPIVSWKFDERTGTSAFDSSGNANTGTLANSPVWNAGKYGSALNFGAANTNKQVSATVTVPKYPTIMGWVNFDDPDSINLVDKYHWLFGWDFTFEFTFRSYTSEPGAGYFIWLQGSSNTSGTNGLSQTYALPSHVHGWHHVAASYDGTKVHIFFDGIEVASQSNTGTNIVSNRTTFTVGGNTEDNNWFDGSIDDVKMYNYPLTAAQVLQAMGNGPAEKNPIGYWKMDEGYGTTTNDSSGNGNAMTLSGSTKPTWTNSGKYAKALSFGGSNAYLAAGSDVSAFKITSDLSLSAWINLTNISSQHDIICKYTGTASTSAYCLTVNTSGNLQMLVTNATGPANVTTTGTKVLSTSTWYHVVSVYNSAGSVTLYVNGLQDTQNTTSIPTTLQNPTTILDVGGENAGSNLMTGTIDEAKVYNYALTTSDIQTDYNQSKTQVLGVLGTNTSYANQAANQQYCVPGDSTSCAAPVGEWNFEEGTGTTANDISGNGNTGTWHGTAPYWTTGKNGKGGNFNGSDDYLEAPTSSTLAVAGDITISAWIKPTSFTNFRSLVSKTGSGGNQNQPGPYDYYLIATTGLPNLLRGNGTTGASNTATSAPTVGAWNFIAVTMSGTSVKHYLNGLPNGSGTLSTTIADAGQVFRIGERTDSASIIMQGSMDDVRIYNYARTAAQIAWDYNHGGPLAQYKFDECQGTVAHDASGTGNNGTITSDRTIGTCNTSSTMWGDGATGKFNSSLSYDGTGDYTEISDNTGLRLTNSLTVSTWVKTSAPFSSTAAGLVRKDTQGGGTRFFWGLEFYILSGKVTGEYYNGTEFQVDSKSTINDGSWHHAVLTINGTTLTLYIDGVSQGTTTITGTQGAPDGVIDIAANPPTNAFLRGDFLAGQTDDTRIYNYPLTATQVQQVYNQGAAVRFGPVTGTPTP